MKLSPGLRLAVAEDIFKDFFTRLTLGLDYRVFETTHLPYIQELFSVLHVNQAFRVKGIDLCARLAKASCEVVDRHGPTFSVMLLHRTRRAIKKVKSKHEDVLKLLRHTRLSIDGAGEKDGVGNKNLLKPKRKQPRARVYRDVLSENQISGPRRLRGGKLRRE